MCTQNVHRERVSAENFHCKEGSDRAPKQTLEICWNVLEKFLENPGIPFIEIGGNPNYQWDQKWRWKIHFKVSLHMWNPFKFQSVSFKYYRRGSVLWIFRPMYSHMSCFRNVQTPFEMRYPSKYIFRCTCHGIQWNVQAQAPKIILTERVHVPLNAINMVYYL